MGKPLIDKRYELRDLMGSGGMADVFLAHDEVLDRNVALKLLKAQYAENEELVERFRREAYSAASLSHPHIVPVFDGGETGDGTYYIAMEYLSGGTLKDRITSEGTLSPQTVVEVALHIAEALRAAHEQGVIHRDIKPRNILITDSGHVKVADFERRATSTRWAWSSTRCSPGGCHSRSKLRRTSPSSTRAGRHFTRGRSTPRFPRARTPSS
jgi:serine/threonine protein kinase